MQQIPEPRETPKQETSPEQVKQGVVSEAESAKQFNSLDEGGQVAAADSVLSCNGQSNDRPQAPTSENRSDLLRSPDANGSSVAQATSKDVVQTASNDLLNNKSINEISSDYTTDGENVKRQPDNREEKSVSDQSISFRQSQENMDRVARVKVQDLKRQIQAKSASILDLEKQIETTAAQQFQKVLNFYKQQQLQQAQQDILQCTQELNKQFDFDHQIKVTDSSSQNILEQLLEQSGVLSKLASQLQEKQRSVDEELSKNNTLIDEK